MLPLKSVSPPYVAVNSLLPDVVKVRLQVPVPPERLPLQVSPLTSLTVITTLPLGVPLLGRSTATEKFTVTAAPVADGSGLSNVIVVVVEPWFTVIVPVPAALNPVPIASDDACALKLPAAIELGVGVNFNPARSEERRVGKECGSRW